MFKFENHHHCSMKSWFISGRFFFHLIFDMAGTRQRTPVFLSWLKCVWFPLPTTHVELYLVSFPCGSRLVQWLTHRILIFLSRLRLVTQTGSFALDNTDMFPASLSDRSYTFLLFLLWIFLSLAASHSDFNRALKFCALPRPPQIIIHSATNVASGLSLFLLLYLYYLSNLSSCTASSCVLEARYVKNCRLWRFNDASRPLKPLGTEGLD